VKAKSVTLFLFNDLTIFLVGGATSTGRRGSSRKPWNGGRSRNNLFEMRKEYEMDGEDDEDYYDGKKGFLSSWRLNINLCLQIPFFPKHFFLSQNSLLLYYHIILLTTRHCTHF